MITIIQNYSDEFLEKFKNDPRLGSVLVIRESLAPVEIESSSINSFKKGERFDLRDFMERLSNLDCDFILWLATPHFINNIDFIDEVKTHIEKGHDLVNISPEASLCFSLQIYAFGKSCLNRFARSKLPLFANAKFNCFPFALKPATITIPYRKGREYPVKHASLPDIGKRPLSLFVDIVDKCNMACRKCPMFNKDSFYLKHQKVSGKIMDFDKCCEAIEKTLLPNTGSVTFSNRGEPLMHPDIDKIVKFCTDRGNKVFISTNMKAMTKELAKRLLENGLYSLTMSVDTCVPETYEYLHKGGKFDETFQNIIDFFEVNREFNIPVKAFRCQRTENQYDFSEFLRFWSQFENIAIYNSLYVDIETDTAERSFLYSPLSERYPCHMLYSNIGVFVDGKIIQCCASYGKSDMGNIFEMDNIESVWNSEYLKRIRSMSLEGKFSFEPCKDCSAWASSFISSYANYGSIMVQNAPYTITYQFNTDKAK